MEDCGFVGEEIIQPESRNTAGCYNGRLTVAGFTRVKIEPDFKGIEYKLVISYSYAKTQSAI